MKPTKQLVILFVLTGLFSLPISAQDSVRYNNIRYSIKNRWNTKLSMSYNRTNESNIPWLHFANSHPIQAKLNIQAEGNYGVSDWLELGGYLGCIRYFNCIYAFEKKNNPRAFAFAPTFGVNANVHLLPFWVKNKNSRWELYLTAKYGGTYLINHVEFYSSSVSIGGNGSPQYLEIHCLPNRYRHIYGVGVGGGVYFWNLFGLYAEVMGGQYSYFQEICPVYYTARVGIEFKFYSKKYKERTKVKEEDEEIEFQ